MFRLTDLLRIDMLGGKYDAVNFGKGRNESY